MTTPENMLIECKDWDQVELVAKKALSEGYKVIASAAGVLLIRNERLALRAFRDMTKVFVANTPEGSLTPIVDCRDGLGTTAIAIGMNTPQGAYLYGVDEETFLAYNRNESLN